jgi:cytochrome P450
MLRDAQTYPDPELFNPDRFMRDDGKLDLGAGKRNPFDIVFGFGRRFVSILRAMGCCIEYFS